MKKCILWGMGNDYELLLNQILFEIHKGNIEVTAIVCRDKDKYCSRRDGFDVITKSELGGGRKSMTTLLSQAQDFLMRSKKRQWILELMSAA